MGQSLIKSYQHIVFSTKNREPFIKDEFQQPLFNYLIKVCETYEFKPISVGGYHDHVHILCLQSQKHALALVIEKLKSHSSKWMKTLHPSLKKFYWQDGYGVFSVSPSHIPRLVAYIENQKEHHKKVTFQKEFLHFLEKYKVEFDEKYIWL